MTPGDSPLYSVKAADFVIYFYWLTSSEAPLYGGRQAAWLYFVYWIYDIVGVGRSGPFGRAAACPNGGPQQTRLTMRAGWMADWDRLCWLKIR